MVRKMSLWLWVLLPSALTLFQGLLRWIDAFEWLCLFAILTLIYFSIGTQEKKYRQFPLWWARLGLFIALLSIVDFCADLVYLQQHTILARYSILVAIFNTILMLPIWLLSLSHYLPKAILKRRDIYSSNNENDVLREFAQEISQPSD